ncbi:MULTISPECIES: DUF3846 domain-containing protein [Glutamicibacter]|uniref:DUF3846 domain-containing protein n=1 Tax=Glutamicibacter TaxID=1742989 RepID=UPI003FCF388B
MAKNIEALKVTADGEAYKVVLEANEEGYTYPAMYKEIGCSTVQYLGADHNIDIVIDEEGKLTDEDINIHATVLATQMGFTFLSGDYIAGTALIVGHDGEGETVSLNEGQKAKIKGILLGAEI